NVRARLTLRRAPRTLALRVTALHFLCFYAISVVGRALPTRLAAALLETGVVTRCALGGDALALSTLVAVAHGAARAFIAGGHAQGARSGSVTARGCRSDGLDGPAHGRGIQRCADGISVAL